MIRKSLLRLQLRNNLVSLVIFTSLSFILNNLAGFFQVAYIAGLALAYNIHSYYGLMVARNKSLLRLSPLPARDLYLNFSLLSLGLSLAFVLLGYLGNIKYFGSGPYNLFLSLRNLIIILNLACLALSLSSIYYLLGGVLAKKIPLFKLRRLASLAIIIFFLANKFTGLNKFLGKYILGGLGVYHRLAASLGLGGLLASSTMTRLDLKTIRPERLAVMERSMFYIGRRSVVMNLGLVLINSLLILLVFYLNYRIYLKTMER